MRADDHPARDDRVLPFTRGLSLFIVPFLVVAWVILYLFPGPHRARLGVDHPDDHDLDGAGVGVPRRRLLLRPRLPRAAVAPHRHGLPRGDHVRHLLGIATLLHWDKFLHSHLAFWLWAGLYFTTPFLVIGAWLANRRYAAPPTAGDVLLRPAERWVVAVVGLAALVTGAVMFLAPRAVIDLWPWALTPLTCRVVAAVFCLGGAGVGTLVDPRWTSLRLMLQVEVVMLVLILVAAVRARDEMISGRALTWPLLVGLLAMLAGSAYLWTAYELRPRPVAPAA